MADIHHDGDGHEVNPVSAEQARPAQAELPAAPAVQGAGAAEGRNVYVIDQGVAGWQQLAAAVPADAQIVYLSPQADGVAQLAAALQEQGGIASLSIFSHGASGQLHLGGSTVDAESVQQQAALWQAIGAALGADGDILLYGCDLARDDTQLLQRLAEFTGADVAASSDATGTTAAGGDWVLEASVGTIEARALAVEGYVGVLAAPSVSTTLTALTVIEASAINAPNVSTAQLSGWTVSDGGNGAVTLKLTLPNGALGSLTVNGRDATEAAGFTFDTAAEASAWLNSVKFTAADVELGQTTASGILTVAVSVGANATLQTATRTLTLNVTPSNDPVVLDPATPGGGITQAVDEVSPAGGTVITAATLAAADPEVDSTTPTQLPVQIVYNLTSAPIYGYLTLSGNRLAQGSIFTQQDVINGKLAYVHTETSTLQNESDTFTVRLNDGATPLVSSDTAQVTLTITPANQAPTVSGSGSVYEGQPANAKDASNTPLSVVGNFIKADGGGDPGDSTLKVRITALPTDGTLYFDSKALTASDIGFEFDYADRAKLTYANKGDADPNYSRDDTFGVSVSDGGGGTGTPASTAATITVNVRSVDDDPVWVESSTLQANVNTQGDANSRVVLQSTMLDAIDVDTARATVTFVVTAASLSHGDLQLNHVTLRVGDTFTAAALDAGLVTYQQHVYAPLNGGVVDSFDFQVVDNAMALSWKEDGTSLPRPGGVYDRSIGQLRTLQFRITLLEKDAGGGSIPGSSDPSAPPMLTATLHSSNEASTSEGGTVGLSADWQHAPGLKYTVTYVDGQGDIRSAVDEAQIVYTVIRYNNGPAGAEGNGVLQRWNGSAWINLSPYDTFTQADLNAGNLIRYQHDGASEDFEASVTLSVSAGALVGGTIDRQTTDFAFHVTPTNDAPTLGGSQRAVIREGETAYITTDQLVVRDADDAVSEAAVESDPTSFAYNNGTALKLRITSLPAAGGTLQYFNGTGWVAVALEQELSVSELSNSADTSQPGFTRLRFVSDGSETRQTNFTVVAVDRWGATSNTATVTIDMTAVNDAPAIASDPTPTPLRPGPADSANVALHATEGSFTRITDALLRAFDPDSIDQQVQYRITTAPAHGSLAYSVNGVSFTLLGAGSSFTKADVAAGRIYYVQNGDDLGAVPQDGQPDDKFIFTVADGDKEQAGNEFWIYFDPLVNDAPVVTAPSATVTVDRTGPDVTLVTGFKVADPDLLFVDSPRETDFLQVTVRLLDASGAPLASAAAYAGISIVPGAGSLASVDTTHNGVNDYLVLGGKRDEIQKALDGLGMSFSGDRNAVYQLQVIADDRLREGGGALIDADNDDGNGVQAVANGGRINQAATPTSGTSAPVPNDAFDAYTSAVPAAGSSLAGNIGAALVRLWVSSVNEAPTLAVSLLLPQTYEDQVTFIGGNFVVSDPESAAFDTPVTVRLTVGRGVLGIGVPGTQTTATAAAPSSRAVTISGDNSATLTLTGRASDIQALLNDSSQGLTYRSATNENHDTNGNADGDATLTLSFDDTGSRFGSGGAANNGAPVTAGITIVPVNDVPTVTAGSGTVYLQGLTDVGGFLVSDTDVTDTGGVADGETDYLQVTVRITTGSGAVLNSSAYVDNNIRITSSALVPAGLNIDSAYNGDKAALRISGTQADIKTYLDKLQVQIGGALGNADVSYRVYVIVDDRVRDASGVIVTASGANGGLNNNASGGTTAVPTTGIDPYGVFPTGLTNNVVSTYRTLFPSDVNDPAGIAMTVTPRVEGADTATLKFTITDVDASSTDQLRAAVTVPEGFTVQSVGGSGGTISGLGTRTFVIDGTLTQIKNRLTDNGVVVALPTTAGVAAADWNGSFDVKVVVNDNGHNGARPGSISGNVSYADGDAGTSAALLTTQTFSVAVALSNDAPVVTNGATQVLLSPTEDSDGGTGQSIDTLFRPYFSDTKDQLANGLPSGPNAVGGSSADNFFGVAIVGVTTNVAQGEWQYSLDGSTGWTAVGTRTDATALVLGTSAALRFVPKSNFQGKPNDLVVRLVETDTNNDSSTLTPASGAYPVDTRTNGGTTVYSSGTITLSTTVANVNDRPTTTDATLPTAGTEGQAGSPATVAALFGGNYGDATDNQTGVTGGADARGTGFGGIAVVGNAATAAQGTWQYNVGSGWQDIRTDVMDAAALLLPTSAQLRFVPFGDFNGTPGSLTVRAADTPVAALADNVNLGLDTLESNNQTSTWSLKHTLDTTVAPRNDAPVLAGTPLQGSALNPSVTESTGVGTGVPGVRLLTGGSVSDIDLSTTSGLSSTVIGAGSLTVTLDAYQAGDILFVADALPSGMTSDAVNTGVGKALTINFSNSITLAQVQDLLNLLAWKSTSDNPTAYGNAATRIYHITVNDGNNVQFGGNAGGPGAAVSNTINGTLYIAAVNDPPVAVDDTNSITEDAGPLFVPVGSGVIRGRIGSEADSDPDNVVANLSVSAVRTGKETPDPGTLSVTAGSDLDGLYGTLRLNADGSYTYTLDNTKPAVNALKSGKSLQDFFTYTLYDSAGGYDKAQLTITIRGKTDGAPTVVAQDGNDGATGHATVYEAGLVDASSTAETTTGSITVTAADGLQTVTVGGRELTLAELAGLGTTAVDIDTGKGTLRLTGFKDVTYVGGVPTAGTLAYS
ncbi:cadherin-like domain-containing protein, partial [Azohydromonas australica]|uniref:cadherin-like domain-containing protein n=1 Tax=Azohydromonas australica TaxID=364039 RepID=UPI001B7FADF9